MAHDYSNLDTGIKSMVMQLTGLTNNFVVKANNNTGRPNLPYISFQRITEQKMQRNNIVNPNIVDNRKIKNTKTSSVRFQSYGTTSFELLDDLIMGQDKETIIDDIRTTYGFNVLSYGDVTDISGITTNVIEPVAFVDVVITFVTTLEVSGTSGEFIEDIEGTGTLKDARNGDINVTFSVDT